MKTDKQVQRVIELASNPPTLAEHGTNRHSKQATGEKYGIEYQVARIARDHPDILARMKAGEFRSVRQAAIAAGILTAQPKKATIKISLDASAQEIAGVLYESFSDTEKLWAVVNELSAALPPPSTPAPVVAVRNAR